jgi:hypothetical protein
MADFGVEQQEIPATGDNIWDKLFTDTALLDHGQKIRIYFTIIGDINQ